MRQFTPQTTLIQTLLLLWASASLAQNGHIPDQNDPTSKPRPSIEAGGGTLSYFGDVGSLSGNAQYSQLNWGMNLTMRNPLSNCFSLDFGAMFGTIRHQENLPEQLVNFESTIKMGSASLSYNFGHILPSKRSVEPYFSIGIATLEFNPKADMRDSEGNYYHMWSDGSLMSAPEKGNKSGDAKPVYRDYNYESDWRDLQGGVGTFSLRTLALPLGAGANVMVNDKFRVRMGASYIFTFTDNLDGINSETTGVQGANGRNDALLYASAGIAYNLHHTRKTQGIKQTDFEHFELDMEDQDGDGITDLIDICPNTPAGTEVNASGCPIDTDGDGVADYIDDEPNSPAGSKVNANGVALTDADIAMMYLNYMDPGRNPNYDKSQTYTADLDKLKIGNRKKGYRVEIVDSEDLSGEEIARLLSVPDIKAKETPNGMLFYLDDITSKYEAVQRLIQLKNMKLEAKIYVVDKGEYFELNENEIAHGALFGDGEEDEDNVNIVFRVQLGAFRYKLSRNVFKEVNDLLVIDGNDGLTRYVSGSFTNMHDAAKHKVNLLLKGYEGAFVTAYRNGKRITLQEAGVKVDKAEDISVKASETIPAEQVTYTIELDSYSGRIPAETLGKYMTLGNVRPVRNTDGVTTYVHGSFTKLSDAQNALKDLVSKGFNNPKLAGEFNGGIINGEEAKKIRGEN